MGQERKIKASNFWFYFIMKKTIRQQLEPLADQHSLFNRSHPRRQDQLIRITSPTQAP